MSKYTITDERLKTITHHLVCIARSEQQRDNNQNHMHMETLTSTIAYHRSRVSRIVAILNEELRPIC